MNQFTVDGEPARNRRPDVVLFVNGLPLAVIELKNAGGRERHHLERPSSSSRPTRRRSRRCSPTNALLVVSDGVEARVGTLTAGREWFKPWRTIAGEGLADSHLPELQVVIEGLCTPQRFLDLVRDFIVFEDMGAGTLVKKMAGYHQFHAVHVAVDETLRASELHRAGDAAEPRAYEAPRKPGGNPATGASAWCGTRRARARA